MSHLRSDEGESRANGTVDHDLGPNAEPEPHRAHPARWRPFHTGVLVGALVAVAVTLLIVQNGHSIRVNWLVFAFQSPAWIVLFVTAAAGAIVWEVARATFGRRRRARAAKASGDDELPLLP